MATKKYLSLERLTEYDALIKSEISKGDDSTLSSAKSYADTELAKKSDKGHNHNDLYYTETEIDSKLSTINTSIGNITNGTIPVKEAEHADSADNATIASDAEKLGGQLPSYYAKASDIPTGALADKDVVSESDLDDELSAKVNAAAQGNHSHSNKSVLDGITSGKVSAWDSAESNANAYTDSKISAVNTSITNITNGSTVVKNAEHATNADTAETANSATTAGSATKATQDGNGNTITSTYETKTDATAKLDEAKAYTDTKVTGMATTTVVDNKISAHNTSNAAHSDIRDLITALSTKVNNFLDVDDTTTDQLSEVLTLIENNKGTLESLTSSKVNVSDIVDNLTTSNDKKVLSAKQGVAIKALIDALQETVDGKAPSEHTHTIKATATDDDVVILTGTNGSNGVTFDAKHATSGVTSGTYRSVTVNEYGHVTGGTNPTTINGYGITDAYTKTEVDTALSGKANETHKHEISDVNGLQNALDGKADASHGAHVEFDSTNKPKMDGIAAFGTSTKVARADHVHPTDTSRAAKTDLDTHTGNTTVHITADERTKWNAAKTHADSAHAPSDAQANVIESIKVNGTAQTITSKSVNITVPTKASDINAAESSHVHAISEITDLQTTLNNAANAITSNTNSINAHTDRLTALETKVGDGFEEITSEEIAALFSV